MSNRDPDDGFPPDMDEKSARGFVPDFVKRVAVAGLGAVFMGEEGLRSLAGQLKLPKEALTYLMSQAEKTKDDISKTVSEEVRRFLQSDKLRDEFLKLLAGMKLEIKAEVKLVPDRPASESDPSRVSPKVVVSDVKMKPQKRR